MGGNNNNEFHGYGGNTASHGGDDDFDEPLYWKYPMLQDLEWEGTLISLPPNLESLLDNFPPKVLPPSETTATRVPPILPPVEDVTYVQPNLHDQFAALQNINSGNKTYDYRQTQFLDSAANQVAPILPAEKLPGSQINHSLSRKGSSSKSNGYMRWSEEEHRLFLHGLQKYGKPNWINISRIIKTRTPTQVASHAQKYFLRQASINKGKSKRRNIHDMVLPDDGPVPHRIYQQNGVSFPNLDGPITHHIHHQNGVPFPNLDGPITHHTDHQNGVPFPNLTKQELYEIHLGVPHYINMQNWVFTPRQ